MPDDINLPALPYEPHVNAEIHRLIRAVVLADREGRRPLIARPLAEWHEEDGFVMWWAWCGHEWAGEPAWVGSPLSDDWPGYHTHWTPHPALPADAQHSGESHG